MVDFFHKIWYNNIVIKNKGEKSYEKKKPKTQKVQIK